MAHQQQQQQRQGIVKKSSDLVVSPDDWEDGIDVDIGGNPSFEERIRKRRLRKQPNRGPSGGAVSSASASTDSAKSATIETGIAWNAKPQGDEEIQRIQQQPHCLPTNETRT